MTSENHTYIGGHQFNQHGDHNTQNSYGVPARRELEDLLRELRSKGAVVGADEGLDEAVAVPVVQDIQDRIPTLVSYARSGMISAADTAVDHPLFSATLEIVRRALNL